MSAVRDGMRFSISLLDECMVGCKLVLQISQPNFRCFLSYANETMGSMMISFSFFMYKLGQITLVSENKVQNAYF